MDGPETISPVNVLLIEDNPGDARLMREALGGAAGTRFQLTQADCLEKAIGVLTGDTRFDLILLDLTLPDAHAWETIDRTRRFAANLPIVILSGLDDESLAVQAVQAGVQDYLVKGQLEGSQIVRFMRHAMERHRLSQELAQRTQQLQDEETKFRALVENSSDSLALLDREGTILYASPSNTRILGFEREEFVGRNCLDFVHPEDLEAASAVIARSVEAPGTPIVTEHRVAHKNGSWVEMEGVVVNRLEEPTVNAIIVNVRDITERRRLEVQVRQSQKLEAIGQLAGGVAHDFNNLLTVIVCYGELLLEAFPPEDSHGEAIVEILKAARRASDLTGQLLAFSRKQVMEPRVLSLNTQIADTNKMLSRLLGEDITVQTDLAPNLGRIRMDPGQIEQIILNLAVNARDAMPDGGTLAIETRNVDVDATNARDSAAIESGSYVMLRVTDTGIGMDDRTKAHIFEPFFTTKGVGKGTGLGLATVYGIVKQNAGHLEVRSAPGEGATFEVCFARVEDPILTTGSEARSIATRSGAETILLVEDDETLRALVRKTLEASGYTILEAKDPLDCLRIAKEHDGSIDLMITDVIMPVMSGRTLADRISEVRPRTRVLYMSGYTDDVIAHHGVLDAGICFIQKPFTPNRLRQRVHEVLDSPVDSES